MKTLLLTGATGYLGSNILNKLVENKSYQILIIKRQNSDLTRINFISNKIKMYDIENLNYKLLFTENGKIDIVIHCATCYGRNDENKEQIIKSNVTFPLELYNYSLKFGVSAFINTDTILNSSTNIYAYSKNLFKSNIIDQKNDLKIKFLNIKLEQFYGPGDDPSKFISSIIYKCLSNETSIKLTKGLQKRDLIYIEDVVSAFITLIDNENNFSNEFIDIGLGSGKAITIKEIVKKIHLFTNSSSKLEFGAIDYRLNEIMYSIADINILKNLGWASKYTFEEGLKLSIKN
jgi:nucleoside-diphosphate-sugar epimerase